MKNVVGLTKRTAKRRKKGVGQYKTEIFLLKKEITLDGKNLFYYNIAVLGDSLDPRLLGKTLTGVFCCNGGFGI